MNKLSKPQKLIYDMEKYAGGSIAVICGCMLIEGSRDRAELAAAVNELYRLNTALRTRITEMNGGTVQSVLEYAERDIDVLRFNSKDELDRYADSYAQQPFDLYGELCEISVVLIPGYLPSPSRKPMFCSMTLTTLPKIIQGTSASTSFLGNRLKRRRRKRRSSPVTGRLPMEN